MMICTMLFSLLWKLTKFTIYSLSVLYILWVIISFINVNLCNLEGGCTTWWNFFYIMVNSTNV